MRSIKPTTVRFDDEDIRLVEIIKKMYGQSSLIGALRVALRIAANEAKDSQKDSHSDLSPKNER